MHIVQLTTELRLSGTEKVIVELAGSLVARGHKVTVISLKPSLEDMKQSIVPELEKLGATVISLNLTKFTPWKIPYLKSLLKKLKPDVIHAHMIHSNILSRFFSPKNTPIVNTVHTVPTAPGIPTIHTHSRQCSITTSAHINNNFSS